MKIISYIFFILAPIFFSGTVFAVSPDITVYPTSVIQGDPMMITLTGVKITDIKNIYFASSSLKVFLYNNAPSAFYGIDLNKKAGDYYIKAILSNGETLDKKVTINPRERYEAPLAVPDKLGGNSPTNQTKVVSDLEKENQFLSIIHTGIKAFWSQKFIYPIVDPIVTDPYGYSRITGQYTISHKGVDFHAEKGTKVMAMNRGVVRVAKNMTVYGKTIVVDHGFGLMTFYMHLSKIKVNEGELVKSGQIIGLSGDTGYAEQPHLHITVRINNVSIDPIKFMGLFK
jgi:murein DD-endopeptidase MepM/ murein hydrolase activator NlpD